MVIPYPVTTGFTCGIAITIMTTQVKDFLGLRLETVPAEINTRVMDLFTWRKMAEGTALVYEEAVERRRHAHGGL